MQVTRYEGNIIKESTLLKQKFSVSIEFETEEEVKALFMLCNHFGIVNSKYIKALDCKAIRKALGNVKYYEDWNEHLEILKRNINV